MFATSVRVSPWSARSSPRSVGRVTTRVSPSRSIFMRCGTCVCSSPSGPLTITRPGSTAMFTPLGISIGFFPIRLIAGSPDEADDLAADSLLGGRAARHDSLGRGQDRRAHASEHARQAILARVDAAARLGDALEVGDDALAVLAELELDDERVVAFALLDPVAGDVALLLENAGDLLLQARGRHLRALVHRLVGVANAREHVGDRIRLHRSSYLPARLRHTGDRALVCELAQADPAKPELAEDRARAPTAVAAGVLANLEPRLAGCLDDQGLLRHYSVLLLVMRPRFRGSMSKSGKDAGSLDASSIGATEDAARRRLSGRRKRWAHCQREHLIAPLLAGERQAERA